MSFINAQGRRLLAIIAFTILLCLSSLTGIAQETFHPVMGPAKISLGEKLAVIDLPSGYIFVNQEESKKFLERQGSSGNQVLGIIAPSTKEQNFFVVCSFDDMGYVTDTDAEKLNKDDILNSYKEGVKTQNDDRREKGIEPIFVGDWAETPSYDKQHHHVVWALTAKKEDSPSAPAIAVNYNTRVLGRRGVLSLNLVTGPNELSTHKKNVATLLSKTTFIPGQTYEDYVAGQDKDSGMGLAGLILGGGAVAAAAKMGIFGAFWKWILAAVLIGKKFVIFIVIGLAALCKRIFGGKKNQGQA